MGRETIMTTEAMIESQASAWLRSLSVSMLMTILSAGVYAQQLVPQITTQPVDLTGFCGNTAVFSVTADGQPPIRYQWLFNADEIPNATNALLTVSNITPAEVGWYTVRITGSTGSILNREASLALPTTATGIGVVDLTFTTRLIGGGFVSFLVPQPNGRVLVGGAFTFVTLRRGASPPGCEQRLLWVR